MTPEEQMPREPLVVPMRWRRQLASVQAAAIAGIVSAIYWSIGLRGLVATPGVDATESEIVAFYADGVSSVDAVVLLQVIVVGTIAFLWFVGVIRSRLGDVGNQTPDPGAAAMVRSLAAIVLSVFAPRVAALFMFSTASLDRATGALPKWLVAVTSVVGIGMLLNVSIAEPGIYFIPAWMALVSVVLLVRPSSQRLELEAASSPTASPT